MPRRPRRYAHAPDVRLGPAPPSAARRAQCSRSSGTLPASPPTPTRKQTERRSPREREERRGGPLLPGRAGGGGRVGGAVARQLATLRLDRAELDRRIAGILSPLWPRIPAAGSARHLWLSRRPVGPDGECDPFTAGRRRATMDTDMAGVRCTERSTASAPGTVVLAFAAPPTMRVRGSPARGARGSP